MMQKIRNIYLGIHLNKMLTRSQMAGFSSDSLSVKQDVEKNRFYAEINGDKATIDYNQKDRMIILIHTEVPEVFRGKGVAKVLAKEAFTYASKNHLEVKIECHYLADYYNSNMDKFPGLIVK